MLEDKNHIDSLFADGLKDLSVQPNPEVWNAINSKLMGQRRKKRMLLWFASAAMAASLLLLFSIANRSLMPLSPVGKPDMKVASIAGKTSHDSLPINKTEVHAVNADVQKQVVETKKINSEINTSKTERKMANVSEDTYPEKWTFTRLAKPLTTSRIANKNMHLPDKLATNSLKREKIIPDITELERQQIESNLMAMNQHKKEDAPKNKWAVLGQLSTAYSNEKSAQSASNGIISLGGGLKVNYAINRKLAVQTGVMYNQFGQDFSSSLHGDYAMDNGGNPDNNETNIKVIPAQTEAGPIALSSGSQLDYATADNTYATSGSDILQTFETVEIPFLIRYNISQRKVGIFVSGGLSTNWIVGNAVYQISNGKTKIGKIEDIRSTNFSSQVGLGFEFKLNDKIHFGLEPSLKYYINSISKRKAYDYKPYSIGIFTGIRYDF
ncbi:outer membrane beta-barrel protein [Ancylomarina longa]|uniref:PorT family protein n=1 Tax=Ancylomarina longa TaxID=2487017 RepID=A0A434AXD3_9BACT|nr:outer membrane beta-barrel protein [Ancylomarina longa]RUT79191.1 PorT family protein [Ancylomarina longa]